MYKYCVVVPYKVNAQEFGRSIESVLKTDTFSETLLVLAFESRLYELNREIFALVDSFDMPNICCVDSVNGGNLVKLIEAKISECEIVIFLDEGDTLDTHLLKYAGYFFEDDYNHSHCGALFFPLVYAGKTQVPEQTDSITSGELCLLQAGSSLPHTLKGGVMLVSTLMESEAFEESNYTGEFTKTAVFYAILCRGSFAVLHTALYYSASDNMESIYSVTILSKAAEYAVKSGLEIPLCLQNKIEEYFSAQLYIPFGESDENIYLLEPYMAAKSEIESNAVTVEITVVQNYYNGLEISGIVCFSDRDNDFEILTDTKIISLDIKPIKECYKDIIDPKTHFTVRLTLNEETSNIRFLHKGQPITEVALCCEKRNYETQFDGDCLTVIKIAPRAWYNVSVIIPAYNCETYLREAVESITKQSLDFFQNIQVVIVNDGSTDSTQEICKELSEKYIFNIICAQQEHKGVSAARNTGLSRAMGKYVLFMDADDKIESQLLETGFKYLNNNENINVAAFPWKFIGTKTFVNEPVLNFRFSKTMVVDIENNYNFIQFGACGVMIRKSALDDISFNENLSFSEDAEFMHKLLLQEGRYSVIEKPSYLYRVDDNSNSSMQARFDKPEWYAKFELFGKTIVEYSFEKFDYLTKYSQYLVIHDLVGGICAESLPDNVDINVIYENIAGSLKFVDDDIIMAASTLPHWFRIFLIKLKYQSSTLLYIDGNKPLMRIGEYVSGFEPQLCVEYVRERSGVIIVAGKCDLPIYDNVSLKAMCEGRAFEAESFDSEIGDMYFLGQSVYKPKIFEFELPVGSTIIEFFVRHNNYDFPVKIIFNSSFLSGQTTIITKGDADNQLNAKSYSSTTLNEIVKSINSSKIKSRNIINEFISEYSRMYNLFSKTRIWLFMDNPKSVGQNVDLYEFCADKKDGIDLYYVIDENTLDGYELSESGVSVIGYGSKQHMILYTLAEKIIISEIDNHLYNPFYGTELATVIQGLINSEVVFIPTERLVKDSINWIAGLGCPFTLVLSSEKELGILPNAVRRKASVVGLPKYDMIEDEGERRIIFMPSWRKDLYIGEHKYNRDFSGSVYCETVNELLCDDRLMDAVEEYGYTFAFAPHEKTYLQLADFDMDEIVEVIPYNYSRKKIAQEYALLITDCMNEYDFAYLGKPVVYYQFAEEDPAPKPAFGETILEHEQLVDLLIEYMKNNCKVQKEQLQRYDDFFAYRDKSNRERIYNLLKDSFHDS